MADIEKVKLSEFFKLFAPTHVVGTTYTLSLAFFESVVLPFIKRTDLESCTIFSDPIGLDRALQEAPALRLVDYVSVFI